MLASFILLIGSGIGGVARHLFNGWPMKAVGTEFPLGILAINFIGSSAMGLVAGWLPSRGTLHSRCGCYSQPAYSGGSQHSQHSHLTRRCSTSADSLG